MSETLDRLNGSTVERVTHTQDGVAIDLRMPDGTARLLAVYYVGQEPVAIRIDGRYVSQDELLDGH